MTRLLLHWLGLSDARQVSDLPIRRPLQPYGLWTLKGS